MWELVYIGIWLWIGVPVMKRFFEIVGGISKIHSIKEYYMPNIPVAGFRFSKREYIKALIFEIICFCVPMYFVIKYNMWFYDAIYVILIIGLVAVSVFNVLNLILGMKYGKYSYLTKKFFASVDGNFSRDDCRFVIEEEHGEEGKMFLHIYKGKKEQLFRYEIIERADEVVRIIEDYYKGNKI